MQHIQSQPAFPEQTAGFPVSKTLDSGGVPTGKTAVPQTRPPAFSEYLSGKDAVHPNDSSGG